MSQNKNLLYDINDRMPAGKLFIAAIQQLTACFVATILIPNLIGLAPGPAMIGAGVGTLIYQLFTRGQSPMFLSSSGAFVSACIGALTLGQINNFTALVIGGIIIAIIYCVFGICVNKFGVDWVNKLLPPIVIGPVVTVIGLNLATFLPTYFQVGGQYSLVGIGFGMLTLIITAIISHYGRGFIKNLPFLIGIGVAYVVSLIFTVLGIFPIINLSIFSNVKSLFVLPDFTFLHLDFANFDWNLLPQTLLLYAPISLVAISEHISDHKALSAIIGTDLIQKPGLGYTIMGDGIASAFGALIGGVPNTSYGESVGTTGFSKIASKYVISLTAILMILAAFVAPLQAFLTSVPSSIFGGCAAILYGFIALSGIKTIINGNINLNSNKNLAVMSAIFTLGVGGVIVNFGWISFGTTALAMIVGIILNLILKE